MDRHFDDSGATTLTTDFSYAEVDERLGFSNLEESQIEQDKIDALARYHSAIWNWVSQGDLKNTDGLVCRSIIMCKVFDPALRDLTYTELAGRIGKNKQSLGRWVDMFKLRFPELAKNLPHLKNDN